MVEMGERSRCLPGIIPSCPLVSTGYQQQQQHRPSTSSSGLEMRGRGTATRVTFKITVLDSVFLFVSYCDDDSVFLNSVFKDDQAIYCSSKYIKNFIYNCAQNRPINSGQHSERKWFCLQCWQHIDTTACRCARRHERHTVSSTNMKENH